MDTQFANGIVRECIRHYLSLGKKGKPIIGKEWTLLSSIVMTLNGKTTVVAMATGTKCLGHNEMSSRGDLVNDSHAEVLARRCFLRFLYDQILKFQRNGTSDIIVACNEKHQYMINPEVNFHLYSSHVPCGDASIIPKTGEKRKCENIDDEVIKRKYKMQTDVNNKIKPNETMNLVENGMKKENDECNEILSDNSCNSEKLKCKSSEYNISDNLKEKVSINSETNIDNKLFDSFEVSENNMGAEGLKLRNLVNVDRISGVVSLPNNCNVEEELDDCIGELVDIHRTGAKCLQGEDRRLPGALYHQVGAVRTKPGRGDPTLSVSCSDKMSRWLLCGLQGALLSLLLSDPVMMTSVIIGGGGQYSAEALRRALCRSGSLHPVKLLHSSIMFPDSRYSTGTSTRACPSAILWAKVGHKPLEVCVDGRKQGATRKCGDNGRLLICKLEFLRTFLSVSNNNDFKEMSYNNLKTLAKQYNNVWAQGKNAFKVWTSKPPLLEDFKLDS